MLSVIRRMIVLISLMFWQGGFMFYGGVVVPVGTDVLGSATEQGIITQAVTNYLNGAGAVCLIIWLEHLWHERRSGVCPPEWYAWGFATLSLAILVGAHLQMDRLLDLESTSVLDHAAFGKYHKLYIATSSFQWVASLIMLFLALARWSKQDLMKRERPA
jgi:hypothetical protein